MRQKQRLSDGNDRSDVEPFQAKRENILGEKNVGQDPNRRILKRSAFSQNMLCLGRSEAVLELQGYGKLIRARELGVNISQEIYYKSIENAIIYN